MTTAPSAAVQDGRMSLEVELVRTNLVAKLRMAGVVLPDEVTRDIVDSALDDAIRLALDWVEGRDRGW